MVLNVNLQHKNYQILIEQGLFNNLGEKIKTIYQQSNIFIITDKNVEALYGQELIGNLMLHGFKVETIVVEPGETSKSIKTLESVYNQLVEKKITKSDLIIAFGGGVVGDLGGFVAATLLRGIAFIQIPTTLLAQIDSSIGGKVAINLELGKNLVGSFYHPNAVFIDPNLLLTLSPRYYNDGMAEVIKYGLIKDYELLQMLVQDKIDLDEIIYRCCLIKKQIVEEDELDTNQRLLLNFGHTIGHALESYFDYQKYTHGEAVAIGMYTITKQSEELNITKPKTADTIKMILKKYNLPYEMPNIDMNKLVDTIAIDKKAQGNNLRIVLLTSIGESFIKTIAKNEIVKFINRGRI